MIVNGYGWHERKQPPTSDELLKANGDWYRYTIEQFGPARCMFESNFPVDRLSCSYTALWNQFKKLTQRFSRGRAGGDVSRHRHAGLPAATGVKAWRAARGLPAPSHRGEPSPLRDDCLTVRRDCRMRVVLPGLHERELAVVVVNADDAAGCASMAPVQSR